MVAFDLDIGGLAGAAGCCSLHPIAFRSLATCPPRLAGVPLDRPIVGGHDILDSRVGEPSVSHGGLGI